MLSEQREELIARHNLYVTFAEIREVKQAIKEGSLWELVEQRSRAHPQLLGGLRRALSHSDWIEKIEPISNSTFFYSGPESALRPEVMRFRKKLVNFDLKGKVLIRSEKCNNEDEFDHILDFKPPFGAYPIELKETYPLNAEVLKKQDHESLTVALQNTLTLLELNPEADFTFVFEEVHPLMKNIGEKARVVAKGE
jgi:7-cyano-7-deazaguanine tRNA-ribosyltransferase